MASNRKFELPETKGSFQLAGTVHGTDKDKFYKEILTKSQKKMRMVNFGVKTSEENAVYVDLNGMERDFVYFGMKDKETKKYVTEKVKWADRNTFNKEGFRMMGVNIGIEQFIDEKGKTQNKKEVKAEFDACEYIANNLQDKTDVFIKGKLEFSSYINDKGDVFRNTKYIPSQISAMKSPIDFTKEGFEEKNNFSQTIVYMGIVKDDSDSSDVKFLLQAKVVTYSTIEDVEFIVRDSKLASIIKKQLKPYNAITVFGNINNRVESEDVVEQDTWGAANPMKQVNKSYIREMVVIGADPSSLDTETYTKESVEAAIQAIKEFGGSESSKQKTDSNDSDWGAKPSLKKDNDSDDWGEEDW